MYVCMYVCMYICTGNSCIKDESVFMHLVFTDVALVSVHSRTCYCL